MKSNSSDNLSNEQISEELEKLRLPSLQPSSLVKHFGPGLVLMMTGIGTSHLLAAPTAGGRFEYALLWCIPVAYILKYYGFEMAFRFTHATGRSLIEAYSTAWRKWPLWYLLVMTIIQSAIGQSGRLVAAAAVLYYFFFHATGLDIPTAAYAFPLGIVCVLIILRGRYSALETAAKIGAAVLFITTASVYLVRPAPLSEMRHFFVFEAPGGSWLIIAAFLGLLPTGMDVSLQASEWGKAKKVGMGRIRGHLEGLGIAKPFDPFTSKKEDLAVRTADLPDRTREYCKRWFRIGLWDFRFGHVVSAIIAAIFLLLSAVWLYPSPIEGRSVMGEIAQIFTRSVGPWMMIVFLMSAFAATFSTAFNYFDGWPRIVAACCRNLFRATARLPGIAKEDVTPEQRRAWYSEFNIYRTTMLFSLVAASAIIAGLERPVLLVLLASAWALIEAPVLFFLNLYYCVTVIPKENREFYPSKLALWFASVALVLFAGLSLMLVVARVLGIALLGG